MHVSMTMPVRSRSGQASVPGSLPSAGTELDNAVEQITNLLEEPTIVLIDDLRVIL